MPINVKTTFKCTDCGEPSENMHGVKYIAGHGFYLINRGEWLCDNCLFKREVEAGLKSDLQLVKKAS